MLSAKCQLLFLEKDTHPERVRPACVSFPMRFSRSAGGAGVSTGTLGSLRAFHSIWSDKQNANRLPCLRCPGIPKGRGGRKLLHIIDRSRPYG